VLAAPRSPGQNPDAQRLGGSLRREGLDPLVMFNEGSLWRTLQAYWDYYLRARPHVARGKDAPQSRPIPPPQLGPLGERPEVAGLHHRYERRAA
jgi:hypothetical protein